MNGWDNLEELSWGDNVVEYNSNIADKLIDDKAIKLYHKNLDIHTIKARQLSDLCGRPKGGEQWRIITEKQFNAFNLILDVIQNSMIEELYVAIYRINEATVASLKELISNGSIKHATFIISNFFLQTKKPERWAQELKKFCNANPDKCSHAYVHNHAKVIAIKDGNDNHYVFEGSGNMSDNARIEQYLYENNRETFLFHKEWMSDLIKKTEI